jgi:hypothetical protein
LSWESFQTRVVVQCGTCSPVLLIDHRPRFFRGEKAPFGLRWLTIVCSLTVQAIDPDYYKALCQILEVPLVDLGLDLTFSCEADSFGVVQVHDLIPNGRNIPVTDENKMEYIQLVTQFRMCVT